MKVTLNWLKQYVDFNWSPEELTERLTMLGLEVEGVQKLGGEFNGIVVAQVITRDKHPNADKLTMDSPPPLLSDKDGKYPVPTPGLKKGKNWQDWYVG